MSEWTAPVAVEGEIELPAFDWRPPAGREQVDLSPPPDFGGDLEDRSIEAELQRIGRSLVAPAVEFAAAMPSNWPAAGVNFESRLRVATIGPPALWPALAPPPPDRRTAAAAAKPSGGSRVAFLAWALVSVGLMALACGGVLLAWSLAAHRDELWSAGLPIALGGQFGLVLGLAWQTRLSVGQCAPA